MDLYREEILDHYKHPRNFGHLDHPDSTGTEHNISCGDKIIMEIMIRKDRKGKKSIGDVRFSGEGCAISQASASMLTEKVMGMDFSAIMKLTAGDIQSWLGAKLTPSRVKCAVLSLEVLQKTIQKK